MDPRPIVCIFLLCFGNAARADSVEGWEFSLRSLSRVNEQEIKFTVEVQNKSTNDAYADRECPKGKATVILDVEVENVAPFAPWKSKEQTKRVELCNGQTGGITLDFASTASGATTARVTVSAKSPQGFEFDTETETFRYPTQLP
jgi:hypothetical protein